MNEEAIGNESNQEQPQITDSDIMQAFNEVRRKPLDVNSKVDWIEFEEFKKVVYNMVAQINNSVADV